MSFGGGGSQPQPPKVNLSEQAQAQSQLAGQLFEAANAPTLSYENTVTNALLAPYNENLQSTLNAQSALQAAAANQAIESETNPRAYQAQQMLLSGANSRLGALYGVNPTSFSYPNPASAFTLPSTSEIPSLGEVASISNLIAPTLSSISFDASGNPTLNPAPASAFQAAGAFNPGSLVQGGGSNQNFQSTYFG